MVFLSICTALYDYVPQGEGEIAIKEGETILILERSTKDEWWMARRRASSEDGAHSVGLIPSNYVEEVRYSIKAKSMMWCSSFVQANTISLKTCRSQSKPVSKFFQGS